MTRSVLLLALVAACDNPPPASNPPPAATPKPAAATPNPPPADAAANDSAHFADPRQPDEGPPPASPGGPPDPELAARVTAKFGEHCKYERSCGDLVGVDCNSAADGPYYYADRKDLATVSTCGGACRRGCTDCPPKAWTCATY